MKRLLSSVKLKPSVAAFISLTELANLFHSNDRPDLRGRLLDEAHARLSLIQAGEEKKVRAKVMLAENLAKFGQVGRALATQTAWKTAETR